MTGLSKHCGTVAGVLWRTAMSVTMLPCWSKRMRGSMLRVLGLKIHPTAEIASMCWFSSKHITFEEGSGCNIGCLFDGHGGITIARNVRIGPRCCFYTTTHPVGPAHMRRGEGCIDRHITVGEGSWVQGSVLLQPGAAVPPGSVVPGGTVVTRSKGAILSITPKEQ